MRICFLGAGNIARAIMGGLIANGTSPDSVIAADPFAEARNQASDLGVHTATDNLAAIQGSEVIVLSVKPNVIPDLCQEISPGLSSQLVISVAAGITTTSLLGWLGADTPLVRCMPNTPALYQSGITGMFATPATDKKQKQTTEDILGAVGQIIWVEHEEDLDAVTAVSGSGPAYYFYVMEAMIKAAENLGLEPDVAEQLVLQTALGAAKMAVADEADPAELRRRVTSPGGTTEAALTSLTSHDLVGSFADAITSAHRRSIELAQGS